MPKEIRIDPRVWIVGPYVECPACHQREFGILRIGGNSYSRRCRACRHLVDFPLPQQKKQILYLDQMVIGNVMKTLNPQAKRHAQANQDPYWREVFRLIDRLVRAQRLVCPHSQFHEKESRLGGYAWPDRRLYEHLSAGIEFEHRTAIEVHQVTRAAQERFGVTPYQSGWTPFRGNIHAWNDSIHVTIANSEEMLDQLNPKSELKASRDESHTAMLEYFEQWQAVPQQFDEIFENQRAEYGRLVVKQYFVELERWKSIHDGLTPIAERDLFASQWTRFVRAVRAVAEESGLSENQSLQAALEFFTDGPFRDLPFVTISSALFAELGARAGEGQKKKPTPGFTTDVAMLSTLLPYCDAFFVDKECDGMLAAKRVQQKIGRTPKIFSARDRNAFLKYLQDIEDGIDQSHRDLLAETYGSQWDEAFETIYLTYPMTGDDSG